MPRVDGVDLCFHALTVAAGVNDIDEEDGAIEFLDHSDALSGQA
jgi:hypothetical protein